MRMVFSRRPEGAFNPGRGLIAAGAWSRIALLILILGLTSGCKQSQYFSAISSAPAVDGITPSSNGGSLPPPNHIGVGALQGTVTDAETGSPIHGVAITATVVGQASPEAAASTDSDGTYLIPGLPPGSYMASFSAPGYITYTTPAPVQIKAGQTLTLNVTLSKALQTGMFRIVLTWNDQATAHANGGAEDLDGYLFVPNASDIVNYTDKTPAGADASLDHDMRYWVGPETITISQLHQGTYIYYVNNYRTPGCPEHGALGKSSAQITVYQDTRMVKQYSIPEGAGETFEVFDIVDGQIVDAMRTNDSLFTNDASDDPNHVLLNCREDVLPNGYTFWNVP